MNLTHIAMTCIASIAALTAWLLILSTLFFCTSIFSSLLMYIHQEFIIFSISFDSSASSSASSSSTAKPSWLLWNSENFSFADSNSFLASISISFLIVPFVPFYSPKGKLLLPFNLRILFSFQVARLLIFLYMHPLNLPSFLTYILPCTSLVILDLCPSFRHTSGLRFDMPTQISLD